VEPLRPVEFEVLLTLSAEDSHEFGIIQATEARTDGEVVLDTATLYRALRRMLAAAWIREVEDGSEATDSRRRVYAITEEAFTPDPQVLSFANTTTGRDTTIAYAREGIFHAMEFFLRSNTMLNVTGPATPRAPALINSARAYAEQQVRVLRA